MYGKESTDGLEGFHKEAMERFSTANNSETEQRRLAIEDALFVDSEDGQWDEEAIEKRRDKPRYTINKIAPVIDQLQGDQLQNRVAIAVDPQKDADKATAEIFTGLIRSIEQLSNAKNAYDNGYGETVKGGYGGWRVLTDYSDDMSFEQEISIKAINSAASSLIFDPSAEEYDCRDANFAFLQTLLSREEFENKYPDAVSSNMEVVGREVRKDLGWFDTDKVRIAEYWYKCPCKKRIGLLSDGRTIDLDEEKDVLDEISDMGVEVVKERATDSYKIKMCVISGAEVLEDPIDWAGKYIPLIPVFGKVSHIQGKKYVRGIVRLAKDAQRIYNYSTSATIEAVALTPKDPIWLTREQAKGSEQSLKTFNTKNSPFMFYKPDPNAPGPPQRGGAPQVQQALIQQTQQAGADIHSTTGMEPASMGGSVVALKSGKAIQAEQNMGDRGAFIFQDNLQKSISYTGEILVDLIPKIYDTERIVQVMGVDGSKEDVTINQAIDEFNQPITDEETGKEVIVNDLSKGKFSVRASSGPAFSVKKKETMDQLLALAEVSPETFNNSLDLVVENMDLNNGEEIRKRVRRAMIKVGTIEPTEEEIKEFNLNQQPPPDPMQEELIKNIQAQTENYQVKTQEIMTKVDSMEADTQKTIAETVKTNIVPMLDMMKVFLEQHKEGLPISPGSLNVFDQQQVIIDESQDNVIRNGEVAGSLPAGATANMEPQQPQESIQLEQPPINPETMQGQ
jgi:hypothetical protein